MSFGGIRTFFEARLLETHPDFQRIESPFNANEIDANNFDKRFHIFFHELTGSTPNTNVTNDVVSARVVLYFKANRDDVASLDAAYDLANVFRMKSMKPAHWRTDAHIKRVSCRDMNAEPLESNDNGIRIELRFSISVMFGTNDDLKS